MLFIMLFLLFLTGMLVSSLIKNRIFRGIVSLIFSAFILLEGISFYIVGSAADEVTIFHIDHSTVKTMFSAFLPQTILLIILFIAFSCILYKSRSFYMFLWRKFPNIPQLAYKIFIPVCIMILIISAEIIGNVYGNIYGIFKSLNTSIDYPQASLDEILKKYDIEPNSFKNRNEITAASGKNVIIILLESMDLSFFNEDVFPDLTPNLKSMQKDENWTYFNQLQGTTHLSFGARYALMTGMHHPGYLTHNRFMEETNSINIPGLGDVFGAAGYNMEVIFPAPTFSKSDKFYEQYGFKALGYLEDYDKYGITDIEKTGWGGAKDRDIFRLAKSRFDYLSKQKSPFFLEILTINAHHPEGICDPRAEFINNCIETAIKEYDLLIKDFLDYISKSDVYKDTVVLILPDHKSIGNIRDKVKDLDRHLFFYINKKRENINADLSAPLNYPYIQKLICDAAEIKSNALLLGELFAGYPPKVDQQDIDDIGKILFNYEKAYLTGEITVEKNVMGYTLSDRDNNTVYIPIIRDGNYATLIYNNSGNEYHLNKNYMINRIPPRHTAYFLIREYDDKLHLYIGNNISFGKNFLFDVKDKITVNPAAAYQDKETLNIMNMKMDILPRDGLFISNNKGKDTDQGRILYGGGKSFGPYINLKKGKYILELKGDNLEKAQIFTQYYKDKFLKGQQKDIKKTNKHIIMEVDIIEETKWEFIIINQSADNMLIQSMTLTIIQESLENMTK